MVIWGALLIPLVAAALMFAFWRKRTAWWEPVVPMAVTVLVILILRATGETVVTRDSEFWGGWATDAQYYEPWDEEVTCSHTYCCGRDSKGNCTSTCRYHAYDVDYHPARWELNGSNGESYGIGQNEFEEFAQRWGSRGFVELNRDFHSIDGNKYVARWNNDERTLEPVATEHSYENRIQASDSVFRFKADPKDKALYGLYEYPGISNWRQAALTGYSGPDAAEADRLLNLINARLGRNKQVKVFVLVYRDKPMQAAVSQQALWMGGNKNEFIVAIGVDRENAVQWVFPFSWSEREDLKVATRSYLMDQKKLDLVAFAKWLRPVVTKQWTRKQFADFSYLRVETPTWCIVLTYILALLITAGISWWSVQNEFDADGTRDPYAGRYGRYRSY